MFNKELKNKKKSFIEKTSSYSITSFFQQRLKCYLL